MNLTKMIIMMFRHCVSDLAWLYQLSTKDLLGKVLSDPLQKSIYQRHCQNLETIYAKFDRGVSRVAFPFLLCLSLSRCASRGPVPPKRLRAESVSLCGPAHVQEAQVAERLPPHRSMRIPPAASWEVS